MASANCLIISSNKISTLNLTLYTESIDKDVSLDSPIVQRYLFLTVDSAEKDRSLLQLVSDIIKKFETLHKYVEKRPRGYIQQSFLTYDRSFINYFIFLDLNYSYELC